VGATREGICTPLEEIRTCGERTKEGGQISGMRGPQEENGDNKYK